MRKPDNGVAAFDVVVKEVQWLSGNMGLKPERYLAEFNGQGVEVNAVDAVANDVADRRPECAWGGLFLTGTNMASSVAIRRAAASKI